MPLQKSRLVEAKCLFLSTNVDLLNLPSRTIIQQCSFYLTLKFVGELRTSGDHLGLNYYRLPSHYRHTEMLDRINEQSFLIGLDCLSFIINEVEGSLVAQMVKNLPAVQETWV